MSSTIPHWVTIPASAPTSSSWTLTDTARHSDRKSTRLNSSHTVISYAVFCLKKKSTAHTNHALDLVNDPANAVSRGIAGGDELVPHVDPQQALLVVARVWVTARSGSTIADAS